MIVLVLVSASLLLCPFILQLLWLFWWSMSPKSVCSHDWLFITHYLWLQNCKLSSLGHSLALLWFVGLIFSIHEGHRWSFKHLSLWRRVLAFLPEASCPGYANLKPSNWLSETNQNEFDSFTALVLRSIAESSGEVETSLLGLQIRAGMEDNAASLYISRKTSWRECLKANCGHSPAWLPRRYTSVVAHGYVPVYLHTVVRQCGWG